MITAVIYTKSDDDSIFGFRISGHAGFAKYGYDIVCAAVSALSINTVNSIEKLTKDKFKIQESDGNMQFRLLTDEAPGTQLLLKSFILGLQMIEASYGDKYIRIIIRKGRCTTC